VALAFLACAPVCFFWSDGVAQFTAALAILLAGFSLDLAMSWLVRNRGVMSGTEGAEHCGFIRFIRVDVLEPVDYVKPFKWLNGRWDLKAPWGKVSFLSVWLWATMVTVATANAPRVAPPVYHFFRGNAEKSTTEAAKAEVSSASLIGSGGGSVESPEPDVRRPEMQLHASSPDYSEQCGNHAVPGVPAPRPQRRELYDQWLGPAGLGAMFAGCARPARREPNGVWYEAGVCDGAVRSLAVAAPRAAGALLLWAPARFGLARAREGSLVGATSSRLVGSGEIYSVATDAGTYLFLRDRLSAGAAGPAGAVASCSDVANGGVPYVTLPPALSRLWSARLEAQGEWLWPLSEVRAAGGGADYTFRSAETTDKREIVGHCDSATNCELRIGAAPRRDTGNGAVDMPQILDSAPPAL
jgi:hypothetical protein